MARAPRTARLHNVWVKRRLPAQHSTDGSDLARIKWLVEENSNGSRWEWVAERSSLLGCENGHLHWGGPAPHSSRRSTAREPDGQTMYSKRTLEGAMDNLLNNAHSPRALLFCHVERTGPTHQYPTPPPPQPPANRKIPTITQSFVLGLCSSLSKCPLEIFLFNYWATIFRISVKLSKIKLSRDCLSICTAYIKPRNRE